MTFDPITGEPIEDSKENVLAFDPITGEPIQQQAPISEPQTGGFDPMTGQPLEQQVAPTPVSQPQTDSFDPMTGKPLERQVAPTPVSQPQTDSFDPMTGKPLNQQAAPTPVSESQTDSFDPMTGKPLSQQATSTFTSQPQMGGFDPMTGKPIQNGSAGSNKKPGKTTKIGLPVIIGGIVGVVAVVLVIIAVSSGLFLGKAGKVLMASANTFKDRPHFVEVFQNTFIIMNQAKYTIALSGEVNEVKLSGELRYGGTEKQLYAQASRKGDTTMDMLAAIDAKNAKFQVPQLSNYVFVYDYNKGSTGYLAEEFGEEFIEMLNNALKSMSEEVDTKKFYTELFKICKAELESVKFTDAAKEDFTIDEKDVSCKGYTAMITSSNMIHIVDEMEKLVQDKYSSLMEAFLVSEMGTYKDTDELFAEMFDEMREELEYMDDIEISFYIYKNKLAGIVLYNSNYDEEIELCFEGGDYRVQNMTLRMGDERIKLIGSDEDSRETFKLEERNGSYRETLGELEYNYENGKFSVELDGMTVSGKMTNSSSEVNFKINSIGASYYSMSPNLDITLKKGVKMEKFDGKEFDLGKADEDAYMDLLSDLQDRIYDKDLDWITYVF